MMDEKFQKEARQRDISKTTDVATDRLNAAVLSNSHLTTTYMITVINASGANVIKKSLRDLAVKLGGFEHIPWMAVHDGYFSILRSIQKQRVGNNIYTPLLGELLDDPPPKN